MRRFIQTSQVRRFLLAQEGATAIEYALIAAASMVRNIVTKSTAETINIMLMHANNSKAKYRPCRTAEIVELFTESKITSVVATRNNAAKNTK